MTLVESESAHIEKKEKYKIHTKTIGSMGGVDASHLSSAADIQ
jgi:hypothetical protein